MLLKYHPDRFRLSRPFAKQAINLYRSNGSIPTMETLNKMASFIINSYNSQIKDMPRLQRPINPQHILNSEISYVMHYAAFEVHGRNVLDFEDKMVTLFKQTDIDEVPISTLNFPFDVFYMSFGKQNDLNLWDAGYYVDGAYITKIENVIQIVLSTIRDDIDYKDPLNWIIHQDRYYYLSINTENPDLKIIDAINQALEEDLKTQEKQKEKPETTGEYGGIKYVEVHHKTADKTIKELSTGFPVFKEALKLVVNGLCYFTGYRDDIETRWPDDTPPLLVDRLKNATKPNAVKKITSELKSKGYTKIHYCGRSIRYQNFKDYTEGASAKAPHWRKGHWRNQAYGEKMTQHKLIWIMPVIVGKDKGTPETGHIYTVKQQ